MTGPRRPKMALWLVASVAGADQARATPPETQPEATALEVLLLPVVAEGSDPILARNVDDVIAADFRARRGFTITTLADLNTLLAAERLKDLVGCDEVACTTDVAGAVGADRILTGRLARLGDEYLLTLRWLDAVNAETLAVVTRQVRGDETRLPETARLALRELFERTAASDETARAHKALPTFWTAEVAAGSTLANYAEPYSPGLEATLRLAWGGRPAGQKLYLYVLGGAGVTYLSGRETTAVREVTYARTQWASFVELRAAFPLDTWHKTRLYAGVGGGVTVELFSAEEKNGLTPAGRNTFPELRLVTGLWHRFNRTHSLYAGYRLRALWGGDGLDSIGELVEQGSTTSTVLAHSLEVGWALHF